MAEQQQGDFISGLVAGAVLGGIIGGLLGVVLGPKLLKGSGASIAPRPRKSRSADQLSEPSQKSPPHSLSQGEGMPLRLEDIQEDADEAIAQARRTLEEKIAQLNDAIRDTRAQLLVQEEVQEDRSKRSRSSW